MRGSYYRIPASLLRERRFRLILQFGAFLGSLVSGIGSGLGAVLRAAAPTALGIGQQFLQREIDRKFARKQRSKIGALAVEALNTQGIAVSRIGGTIQPVGGPVQRSTFTPAVLAPAHNPIGGIPLLPVAFGRSIPSILGPQPPLPGLPFAGFGTMKVPPFKPRGLPMPNGALALPGAPGEPRFAKDQFGRTIMFVPSPRPGEGFLAVAQARQLGLAPTKPFYRFNRLEGQFEKIKGRRMNPFNFKATKRAGRRVERTLDAVKELVRIEKKMTTGKVRLKRTKRRKR